MFNCEKHLRFNYGDREKMKASLLMSLAKYEAVAIKSAKVNRRISDIKASIEWCDLKPDETGQIKLIN